MKTGKIAKALIAAIGGLCTALAPVLADEVIGLDEYGAIATALAAAGATIYGVWRVPNRPST